eukprot:6204113-Pleurochrysis_carterae.AAC.3
MRTPPISLTCLCDILTVACTGRLWCLVFCLAHLRERLADAASAAAGIAVGQASARAVQPYLRSASAAARMRAGKLAMSDAECLAT